MTQTRMVPHISRQDNLGTEGVLILEDPEVKKVKVGSRTSNNKIKRSEFDDAAAQQVQYDRHKIHLETNTKDMQGNSR